MNIKDNTKKPKELNLALPLLLPTSLPLRHCYAYQNIFFSMLFSLPQLSCHYCQCHYPLTPFLNHHTPPPTVSLTNHLWFKISLVPKLEAGSTTNNLLTKSLASSDIPYHLCPTMGSYYPVTIFSCNISLLKSLKGW